MTPFNVIIIALYAAVTHPPQWLYIYIYRITVDRETYTYKQAGTYCLDTGTCTYK